MYTDIDEIRENMGYCPQHDILFGDFTVREHLQLFGKFKSIILLILILFQ